MRFVFYAKMCLTFTLTFQSIRSRHHIHVSISKNYFRFEFTSPQSINVFASEYETSMKTNRIQNKSLDDFDGT